MITLKRVTQRDIALIKGWVSDSDNAKWLDAFFQADNLRDEQLALFLMHRDKRTFLILLDEVPVGITGLTEIDEVNRSAAVWGLVGKKELRGRGIFTTALFLTLGEAFRGVGLNSIHGWAVEGNVSIHICEKLKFRIAGRLRACHLLEGVLRDRVLLDMLSEEFDETQTMQAAAERDRRRQSGQDR